MLSAVMAFSESSNQVMVVTDTLAFNITQN